MSLVVPNKSINGSHWPSLVAEATEAMESAQSLLEQVQRLTVHGRDFTDQPASVFNRAVIQKRDLVARVQEITEDLRKYAEALHEKG